MRLTTRASGLFLVAALSACATQPQRGLEDAPITPNPQLPNITALTFVPNKDQINICSVDGKRGRQVVRSDGQETIATYAKLASSGGMPLDSYRLELAVGSDDPKTQQLLVTRDAIYAGKAQLLDKDSQEARAAFDAVHSRCLLFLAAAVAAGNRERILGAADNRDGTTGMATLTLSTDKGPQRIPVVIEWHTPRQPEPPRTAAPTAPAAAASAVSPSAERRRTPGF